jgi:hypothetical protein
MNTKKNSRSFRTSGETIIAKAAEPCLVLLRLIKLSKERLSFASVAKALCRTTDEALQR